MAPYLFTAYGQSQPPLAKYLLKTKETTMKKLFYLRVILGLIVLSCIVWGQMPQLEPYQHQNITLDIPQGWQVTQDDQTGTITISLDPKHEDAPELQVTTSPYTDNNEWLMESSGKNRFLNLTLQSMEQESGNKMHIIEEKDFAQGNGKLILIETTVLVNGGQMPAKAALLLESSPHNEIYIFAAFAAKPEDFENLGGENLLMEVTSSIQLIKTSIEAENLLELPETAVSNAVSENVLTGFDIYSDDTFTLQIPQGWQATRNGNSLIISQNSQNPTAPNINLQLGPYIKELNLQDTTNALLKELEGSSPNKFTEVATYALSEHKGELVVFDVLEEIPLKMAILVSNDPKHSFTIAAFIVATANDFNTLDGASLLTSVATSAYPTGSTPAQASTPIELPLESTIIIDAAGSTSALHSSVRSANSNPIASGSINPEQLIGRWKVSEMSGIVDQKNFATNTNMNGSSLNYTFNTDGTYTLLYKMSLWTGMFTSAMEITEVGRYTLTGNTLDILPNSYNGWSYFGAPANKQNMTETNLPSRQYKVVTVENYIVLTGVCAKFQADPYCKDKKDNLNVLEFPLQRAN